MLLGVWLRLEILVRCPGLEKDSNFWTPDLVIRKMVAHWDSA